MNEADFIAAMRRQPLHPGARDLRDDCAVLEVGGETLVLNTDSMAEGVHFRPGADMADVAWKLVASNLSDLAAKGAQPLGLLLNHALGRDDEAFSNGLNEACRAFDVPIMGGDTVAAKGPRVLSVTVIGRATHIPVPSRSGAQIGDAIWVTGTLGQAMLGFEGNAQHLSAFNRPNPRLSEGQALAPLAGAMMDISDGLLLDAFRMAEASGVSLSIDSEAVPVADRARAEDCMRWGDDYELLFTLSEGINPPISATAIGRVEPHGFAPLSLDGNPLVNAAGLGFEHSQSDAS